MFEFCVLDALGFVAMSAKVGKSRKGGQDQGLMRKILPLVAYVVCNRHHAPWELRWQ
jgi:hypothetical protein